MITIITVIIIANAYVCSACLTVKYIVSSLYCLVSFKNPSPVLNRTYSRTNTSPCSDIGHGVVLDDQGQDYQ